MRKTIAELMTDLASAGFYRDHAEIDATRAAISQYVIAEVAAERERWERERKDYRSLLMQARVVLRGPHTEHNIVVRELVERIEARGVQFLA